MFFVQLLLLLIATVAISKNSSRNTNQISEDSGHCDLLINEINLDNPENFPNYFQFIELFRACGTHRHGKGNRLAGYKLLLIRGYPLSLTMVIDLNNMKLTSVDKGERYDVIAGPNVQLSWSILISGNEHVQSIYGDNILPVGDETPFALVLVHSKNFINLRPLSLEYDDATKTYWPLDLNPPDVTPVALNTIKLYKKDMLVYGRRTTTNRCNIFDSLWPSDKKPKYAGENYLLRDYDYTHYPDLSLNLCSSELEPYSYNRFKLGVPSPGKSNDCSGVSFFVEDHIDDVSPRLPSDTNDLVALPGCQPDNPEVTLKRYRDIDSEVYRKKVKSVMDSSPACYNPSDATVEQEMEIQVDSSLIIREGGAPFNPPIRSHSFNPDWVIQCSKYLPFDGRIIKLHHIQSWLDIKVESTEETRMCRFSCYSCKTFFELGYRSDIKRKPAISTAEGYYSNRPTRNNEAIENHEKSSLHQDATKLLTNIAASQTHDDYLKVLKEAEENDNKLFLPTIRIIKFVYAEIIADVPFSKHSFFMDVLKSYDIEIGHHHRSRSAAIDITKLISSSFHVTLLKHLVQTKLPFALMCDSSTDRRNIPYLIVYFQSLEDSYPIVYLYGLIPLNHGESSREMIASFKQRVQADTEIVPGFEEFFKEKLTVLSTDGCPTMIGPNQSFKTEMAKYVGHSVPLVWCMAHRINLAVQNAILKNSNPEFKYFVYFEKLNNRFFSFYLSRGSKKFQHMAEIATHLHMDSIRLKYKFEIRWASSHRRAVQALQHNYELLSIDLTAIATSGSEFSEEAKKQADELHTILEDKTFPIVLEEYIDFLEVYQMVSLKLQATQGLLVEKYDIIMQAISDLNDLKKEPGAHLATFLKSCTCASLCLVNECTLKQYFECDYPVCNRLAFRKCDPNGINFANVRDKLYTSLIDSIIFYFNVDLLESFELFNPKKFTLPACPSTPETRSESHIIQHYHYIPTRYNNTWVYNDNNKNWDTVCNFYYLTNTESLQSCKQSKEDWNSLLESIRGNSDFQNNIDTQASRFWPYALQDASLPWTTVLRNVVTNVLITPFGTADAERGFSYLNNLKSNERISLSPDSVESLIRIKVNGPKRIETFDAVKYAREFIKAHGRSDDLAHGGGRPHNPLQEKSFFRDSRLF